MTALSASAKIDTRNGPTSYEEAIKFLDALMEGVPEDQHLEIRTLKKGGGGRKEFYSLADLRQQGFATALPGHLDGKENVYYGAAPRYEPRKADSDTDRGDAVSMATCVWLDEITCPAPDLPRFSWMVETSVGKVQAGYLLEEPTADLDRLEHLNQRLDQRAISTHDCPGRIRREHGPHYPTCPA